MNAVTANRVVMVTMVVTALAVTTSYFRKSSSEVTVGDGFKTAWALGALYLVLSIGADLAPEVAGPLALLILLAVLFAQEKTLTALFDIAGKGKAKGPWQPGDPYPQPGQPLPPGYKQS